MKLAVSNKILWLAALLFWAILVFQFFNSNSNEPVYRTDEKTVYTRPEFKVKEKFELLPVEKDPFLGTLYTRAKTNKKSSGPINSKETRPWPNIQYVGVVADTKAKRPVFVVNINGKQQLLKKGETSGELTLVNGNSEEVRLKFNGAIKAFSKIE